MSEQSSMSKAEAEAVGWGCLLVLLLVAAATTLIGYGHQTGNQLLLWIGIGLAVPFACLVAWANL